MSNLKCQIETKQKLKILGKQKAECRNVRENSYDKIIEDKRVNSQKSTYSVFTDAEEYSVEYEKQY